MITLLVFRQPQIGKQAMSLGRHLRAPIWPLQEGKQLSCVPWWVVRLLLLSSHQVGNPSHLAIVVLTHQRFLFFLLSRLLNPTLATDHGSNVNTKSY